MSAEDISLKFRKGIENVGYLQEIEKGDDLQRVINLLILTFDFAAKIHEKEKRASGRLFLEHPTNVALSLVERGADLISILSGLLHDTAETLLDSGDYKDRNEASEYLEDLYRQRITENLGEDSPFLEYVGDVFRIVAALTRNREDIYYQSIDQIFLLADDGNISRTFRVKCADRYNNALDMKVFGTQRKLYSLFKNVYIAHELRRYLRGNGPVPFHEELETSLRDLASYSIVVLNLMIGDFQSKESLEVRRKLVDLESEVEEYRENGGFNKITSESEGGVCDGVIQKYDRMIRRETGVEIGQGDREMYIDALAFKNIFHLLRRNPDYEIEGFEWRMIQEI
jgi:hypothetical protein